MSANNNFFDINCLKRDSQGYYSREDIFKMIDNEDFENVIKLFIKEKSHQDAMNIIREIKNYSKKTE